MKVKCHYYTQHKTSLCLYISLSQTFFNNDTYKAKPITKEAVLTCCIIYLPFKNKISISSISCNMETDMKSPRTCDMKIERYALTYCLYINLSLYVRMQQQGRFNSIQTFSLHEY